MPRYTLARFTRDVLHYARKAASGQGSFNWDEDKHPRNPDGTWSDTEGGATATAEPEDDEPFSLISEPAERPKKKPRKPAAPARGPEKQLGFFMDDSHRDDLPGQKLIEPDYMPTGEKQGLRDGSVLQIPKKPAAKELPRKTLDPVPIDRRALIDTIASNSASEPNVAKIENAIGDEQFFELVEVDPNDIKIDVSKSDAASTADYAQDFDPESVPPVVITRDGAIVDGRHRVAAAIKSGAGKLRAWFPSDWRDPWADRYEKRDDSDCSWVTMGAQPGDDGERTGGTPVCLKDGKIQIGPQKLEGRSVNRLKGGAKGHGRNVLREVAKSHGLDKAELDAAIADELKVRQGEARDREAIKKRARELTGMTERDVARAENAMRDHSTAKKFDTAARSLATEHPELGWNPDGDNGDELWEMLREGKQRIPQRYDEDLIRDVASDLSGRNERAEAAPKGNALSRESMMEAYPPPADESEYLPRTVMDKQLERNYFDESGEKIASSREKPAEVDLPPVGSWRIDDDFKGIYGRTIDQLVEFTPDQLGELVRAENNVETNAEGRGWDAERYEEWMKEGKEPPPLSVLQLDDGRLRIVDGHRRHSAAMKAGKPIKAWVNWAADSGQVDSNGRPMMRPMTDEAAKKLEPAKPEPEADDDFVPGWDDWMLEEKEDDFGGKVAGVPFSRLGQRLDRMIYQRARARGENGDHVRR